MGSFAGFPPQPGEENKEREREQPIKKTAGLFSRGGEFIFSAAHGAYGHRLSGNRSKLKKHAQFVDETVGVFRALGLDDGGLRVGGEDAFGFHLAFGEQFAEFAQEFGVFLEAFGEDGLADFHDFAIRVRQNGGAAALAGQQGHFAKTIAAAQTGDVRGRAVAFDDDIRFAGDEDEHGIAIVALLDDFFVAAKVDDAAARKQGIELVVRKRFEQRLLAEHEAGGGLDFLLLAAGGALQLDSADGEGDFDAVPVEAVPDIGADGVADFIVQIVIVHPELDVVFHGVIAEVFEINCGPGFRRDAFGVGAGVKEDVFDAGGRDGIINTYRDAHGVAARGEIEVDDELFGDVAVGDLDGDVINGAHAGGAPVDVDDLGILVIDEKPVAILESFAGLEARCRR